MKYAWVISCGHGWETMSFVFALQFGVAGTFESGEVEIWSDQLKEIVVVDGVAAFVIDLTRVSGAHDEVEEIWSDRPKESDGVRENSHDDLHVPVLCYSEHRHRVRGVVVATFSSEAILNHDVIGLGSCLGLCPARRDHLHGTLCLHHVHAQIGLSVRFGEMNRSLRSAPCLRDGGLLLQLWKAAPVEALASSPPVTLAERHWDFLERLALGPIGLCRTLPYPCRGSQ